MTAPALGARPDALHTRLDDAIDRAQERALRMQHADGYWHAPLEACVGMDAQYIIFNRFLGRRPAESEQRLVANILARAVDRRKLEPLRRRPRAHEHDHRGVLRDEARGAAGRASRDAPRARVHPGARRRSRRRAIFTRFFLALLRRVSVGRGCRRCRSSWCCCRRGSPSTSTRCRAGRAGRVVPLTMLMAKQPRVPIAPEHRVPELWVRPPTAEDWRSRAGASLVSWRERLPRDRRRPEGAGAQSRGSPLRASALRARAKPGSSSARSANGGWGGIQPPMINCVMALRALGYPDDHPALRKGIQAIETSSIEHEGRMFFQPCVSPTWDTALTAKALLDSGMPGDHPALVRAADWLIDRTRSSRRATGACKQSRPRAGRLGLRVRERLVSRRRRHARSS